jgi:translocation and assembly module TamB
MTNALSHVCVKGHYAQAHDFSLSIDSDYFDNKSLDPFIHPMNATGMSQFHLDLKRDSSGLDAKGNVGSDHAILTLDHQPVQFTMFQLKATHHDNASNIALHFLTEKNDTGEVQIELSKQDRDSPHLKGTMDLHLKELNPINLYLSNLYEIEGTIEAKVQLSGTLKEPVYEGSFLIDGSTARIPQLGLVLDHIALDVSGNHNSQIHVKGSAQSGEKGRLALAGAVTLTQQKISSDFTLKGDDLPLIDLPTAQATGSLDLAFQQKQGEAKLSGTVHLYDGKFDGRMLQRRFGSDTDIVFVTDGSVPITEESSSLATAYDIHLIVDDRVRFSGFDVNTQIGGEATIHSSPQGLATANGQFNLINGSYDAYSKHFTTNQPLIIPA